MTGTSLFGVKRRQVRVSAQNRLRMASRPSRKAKSKLGKTFDQDLRGAGLSPKRLRPCSPSMNAFVERWIQSIQLECLDHFIVFGEAHLNHIVSEYVVHFETERPHQGLDNRLVQRGKPPDDEIPKMADIACRERLGGLLKHYERRAA